jgi:hypothetical protein
MIFKYKLKIINSNIEKIQSIRAVRLVSGCGLEEARNIVSSGSVDICGEQQFPISTGEELLDDIRQLSDIVKSVRQNDVVSYTFSFSLTGEITSPDGRKVK